MTMTKFQLFLFTALLGAGCSGAVPNAAIPFAKQSPAIDGVFDENEWRESCVIRQITPMGDSSSDGVNTTFYLKYDKQNLYVAAVCEEPNSRGPEAYPRPWNDAFFNNDDTVQLVMGVADPEIAVRGKVNVGGYVGAMDNEFTAADFYYTYSVNAVNSRQRQFNEAPQEKDLFRSAVSKYGNGRWVTEMEIPFSSCGLNPVAGQKIYANLFRYRPPQMYGWHLPGYGGYNPMPLGEFIFLPEGKTGSQEHPPVVREKRAVARNCQASVIYGPLNGVILGVAEVTGEYGKLVGELEVSGFPTVRQELEFNSMLDRDGDVLPSRQAIVSCKLPSGDQIARQTKFRIYDENGKLLSDVSKDCPAAQMPEWLGTQAGMEYVEEKIPRPWIKPEISGNRIKLVDKVISIGKNGLPDAVERLQSESSIFSGVPQIVASTGGAALNFSFADLSLALRNNQVLAGTEGTSGEWRLRLSNQIDFDGFMEIKFALSGGDLSKVERLEVLLPLDKKIVKFLLPGVSVQRAGELTGAGYRGRAENIWIGNQEEGISFSFDRNPFHSADLRHQIEIVQTADGDYLKLNLVDQLGQLSGKEAIFRFFLQPTPTKPYAERPVRGWVTWLWENWSRWHGYPDLSKIDEVKKQVNALAAKGRELTLYCCQGLQEDAPEMMQFRTDLELQPPWRYYFWQGKNCFATCKRGPEGDLQLHNYQKIIAETGIRGLMSDGLSVPWSDSNPLHGESCGEMTKLDMDREIESRIVKQRKFLKRMRGLFDATGEEYCLVAHTGGGIDVNTLSFFDSYFEGEQLMRFRRGYYPSEAMFSIGYSGLAWGWRTIYWPKQLHNYDGLDSALAYALLFNSEYYTNDDVDPVNIDVEILERFAKPGNSFHPFWKPQEKIGFASEQCYVSLYYGVEESLAVVSNLRYGDNSYEIDLRKLYPGQEIEVLDYLRKTPLDTALVKETLKPFSCTLLVVRPKKTVSASAKVVEQQEVADGGDWTISPGEGNRKNVDGSIQLKGVPGAPAARAELKGFDFSRDFSARIEFTANGRMGLNIGNIDFLHDHGWIFYNELGEDLDGVVDRFAALRNGKNTLDVSVRDGVMSARLNNRLVVHEKALKLNPGGNTFAVRTWHDNTVVFKATYIRNYLSETGSGVESFKIRDQKDEWVFGNMAEGIAKGDRFVLRASPEKGLAVADFNRCFEKDFYLNMMVKLPERFNFVMGNAVLSYGGGFPGWGWMIRGLSDPYSRGWVFQQVPLAGKEYKSLEINLRNGTLDVLYDGKVVVKNLTMTLPEGPNGFSIQTWHDDVIDAKITELSTSPRDMSGRKTVHPIQE